MIFMQDQHVKKHQPEDQQDIEQLYNMYLEGKQKTAVTSFKILETGNYDIVLIENYSCDNKDQLLATRERYKIETLDCVNKVIPKRTGKEYEQDNRDKK